jgi:hypothetical protein
MSTHYVNWGLMMMLMVMEEGKVQEEVKEQGEG